MSTIDGAPFIPGTSISGTIRTFCNDYFGYNQSFFSLDVNNSDFFASPFSVSDGVFLNDSPLKTTTRDGIAIKGYENGFFEKVTVDGAKYDYEVVQKGAYFEFAIEYTLRENYQEYLGDKLSGSIKDDLLLIEEHIKTIAKAFNENLISLGFKKNRGLGSVKVVQLVGNFFYADTLRKYLNINDQNLRVIKDYQDVILKNNKKIIVRCSMKLDAPLSIKAYSDNLKDDFDFTQISYSNNGKMEAVIPGSSLMGAIRHQMEKICYELNIECDLTELFGTVEGSTRQSKIKSKDTYIGNGLFLKSTRTSIDRFSGSALNSHLFTQKIYINTNDEFILTFIIDNNTKLYPYIGLLLLALTDLGKGYCSLGGSSAIGYGILKSASPIKINNQEIDINNNEYVTALALFKED